MSKNKLTVDFSNFEEYARKIDRLNGDLRATVQKALEESRDLVNGQLHEEMKKHIKPIGKYGTGMTDASIKDGAPVEWSGTEAVVDVGFDLSNGGLPSVFLMKGTPRMAKDQKLYNAIYGSNTRKKVHEIMERIFQEELQRVMGG